MKAGTIMAAAMTLGLSGGAYAQHCGTTVRMYERAVIGQRLSEAVVIEPLPCIGSELKFFPAVTWCRRHDVVSFKSPNA